MGTNQDELEKQWRQRWREAKLSLELARIHLKEIQQQSATRDIPDQDYHRSLHALTIALLEYSRVRRIYTDLRTNGKAPHEE